MVETTALELVESPAEESIEDFFDSPEALEEAKEIIEIIQTQQDELEELHNAAEIQNNNAGLTALDLPTILPKTGAEFMYK